MRHIKIATVANNNCLHQMDISARDLNLLRSYCRAAHSFRRQELDAIVQVNNCPKHNVDQKIFLTWKNHLFIRAYNKANLHTFLIVRTLFNGFGQYTAPVNSELRNFMLPNSRTVCTIYHKLNTSFFIVHALLTRYLVISDLLNSDWLIGFKNWISNMQKFATKQPLATRLNQNETSN